MTGIETVFAILLSGLHWGFASTILWNCLCEIILFTDKLNPSTDNFPFYYINVKFFEKSVKCCDVLKPFPKKLWQSAIHRPTQCQAVIFRAHKPRQSACVGFVCSGRVRLRAFCLRDTGQKRAAGRPTALKNYCVITSPMGYSISYSARYIWIIVASAISTVPSWFASSAWR